MTTTELQGIAHELKFWKGFVQTDRFLKGWVAPIKTPELHQETYDFIKSVPHDTVLDVGSGVCSILNGTVPKVTTADPLGELYELIFDYKKYNLQPPFPIPAEEIGESGVLLYSNDKLFDIVHISNALDHTQNPLLAVQQLYKAVKPGGFLIIQGFENEGSFEKWQGFHKWDIHISDAFTRLECKGQDGKSTEILYNPYNFYYKKLDNKAWYIWIQQKQ